jgi:predicted nuclease of predicted toxin-antitoxin system
VRLLLDENRASRRLVDLLRRDGHEVQSALHAAGAGAHDAAIFSTAKAARRAIITMNCGDFVALASKDSDHAGLLLVYQNADLRDMTIDEIARAVRNVANLYSSIAGMILNLNEFRW